MAFLRAYVAPFLIVLTFVVAMVAVSARIFLPSDMMAPAPIEETLDGATAPAASLDTAKATATLPNNLWVGDLG